MMRVDEGLVEEISALIREHASFLLCLHLSPDADSIGSSLAAARALDKLGKSVAVVSSDPVPRMYRFLPGVDRIMRPEEAEGPWEVALLLDLGSLERAGAAAPLVESCCLIINVDHHETNSRFGDVAWVDPRIAATGAMVFYILEHMKQPLDQEQATCLYAALATDTGFFSHGNTSAPVHFLAGQLVQLGACPKEIGQSLRESRSLAGLKLLARALDSLSVEEEGLVATMQLSRADIARWEGLDEDLNGIVNYARSLSGVEVGIFLVEREGEVKVGFRSRKMDVGQVAAKMGGGGHPNAAGATVSGSLEDVRRKALELLREALKGGS